jgi:hypothetical protein
MKWIWMDMDGMDGWNGSECSNPSYYLLANIPSKPKKNPVKV